MSDQNCIFCKIARKEIPTNMILEGDDFVAFHDINGQAPVHALIIPKKHYNSLNEADNAELMGNLMLAVPKVAEKLGIKDSFRVVINTGEQAGQTVFHLHIHLLGGRPMLWPPG